MISIIIPVGDNCEKNLDLVLYALTRQTYTNFEVVLCCDGVQGVQALADEYGQHFRLQYSHEPRAPRSRNLGAINRNRGVKLATSDRLLFLDSSVVLGPEVLAYYYEDFECFENRAIAGSYEWMKPMRVTKNDIGQYFGDLRKGQLPVDDDYPGPPYLHTVGPDPRQRWFDKSHPFDRYSDYLKCLHLLSGNMAITKALFRGAGGFWTKLTRGIDGAFGLAVLKAGYTWSFDKRCKGYHLYHDKDWTDLQNPMPHINARFHSDNSWIGQMKKNWGWPWLGDDWGREQRRHARWRDEEEYVRSVQQR